MWWCSPNAYGMVQCKNEMMQRRQLLVNWARMCYIENNIRRAHSSDKSPKLWTIGIKIGFKEVTPTIPSWERICMVGLKIFSRSFQRKKSAIIGNSIQELDQGLRHMKGFKDRRLQYPSMQSYWRETEITLSDRGVDSILWKEPSRIYGEPHSMLQKCRRKWSSSNLPARRQNKNFDTDVKSVLTVSSSQKFQIWDCLESNHELNTRVIEYFLLFPTITCTPVIAIIWLD
jgi:hypothetical protein